MVRANRPWRVAAGLSRALVASLGTAAFALTSPITPSVPERQIHHTVHAGDYFWLAWLAWSRPIWGETMGA
jgi:hypothetical protein